MAHLLLRDVRKSYGQVATIHGVGLEVRDGEFVVFVGPSGCGKSTLLRMIAGLEGITAGEILIDGAVVNGLPASERGLAMVFQSYALYPHMSVYKNMAFGLENMRMAQAEVDRRVRRAGEMLRLTEYFDRKPGSALRRPAPARRHRAGHRARPQDLPLRRAALQSRRRAARLDAQGARRAARRARRHHDLRDARPDGGDDARQPHRGAARRAHRAGRGAARSLQRAGQPVRRRLHRLHRA